TSFGYDSELRLVSVTDSQGSRWSYDYDPVGRLIRETDFAGRSVAYRYDEAGRLVERVNGAGQSVAYVRDPRGNAVEERVDGRTTTFAYDSSGLLTGAANAAAELVFVRDAAGRVLEETGNGRTVAHTYDALGRRSTRRTPSGVLSRWSWDAADRPAALELADRRMDFGYDAAGREVHRELGVPAALTRDWDADDRLTGEVLTGAGGTTIRRRGYGYRQDGAVARIADSSRGERGFTLDALGRITAVRTAAGTGPHAGPATDAAGSLETYGYDSEHRVTSARWPAAQPSDPSDGSAADAQGDRSYDGIRLRRAGRVHYDYDGQGRVVRQVRKLLSGGRRVWEYAWDAYDRLVSVVTPSGGRWHYTYDALGRRISKERAGEGSVPGGPAELTEFVWDGTRPVEQVQDPGTPRSRTVTWEWEPDSHRPLAQYESASCGPQAGSEDLRAAPQQEIDRRFYAIVTDLAGSAGELIDEQGAVVWSARNTVWGVTPEAGADGASCPLRFPGQYHDSETGLHYNLYRYYDPLSSRYLSPDPLGLDAAPDPYGYPYHPLIWSDPLGLTPCIAKQLAGRASEIHALAGGPIAMEKSTVAVIRARTPFGVVDVVAGSGRGLNGAQKAMVHQGEILADNIAGTHAEQNAMLHIIRQGWQPVAGGASRSVCSEICAPLIRASGGKITGEVFQQESGTKTRTFLW
ncbi:MAG: hypothetical protein QOF98_2127, partial [Streptomyces sp.]|nr:hypothetical protein [Streptomyces sp.]